MVKFDIGTKVKVKATGEQGEIIGIDGYGSGLDMYRLNPKPYVVQVGTEIPRYDEVELELELITTESKSNGEDNTINPN